jgi:hypothetical protein
MHGNLSELEQTNLGVLRSALHACVVHPDKGTAELARASYLSTIGARRAMTALSELGLVSGNDDAWRCNDPSLTRSATEDDLDDAMRRSLLSYRPFEAICEGLILGEYVQQAVLNASVALGLSESETGNLSLLLKWGADLQLCDRSRGRVTLSPDLRDSIDVQAGLPNVGAKSTAETRLSLSTLLGRDAFERLDEVDRMLLVEAVDLCDADPPASAEASGQALEDFLREVCVSKGLESEASKAGGACKLAQLLLGAGLIHSSHVKLVEAASVFRNAKVHKKDRKTNSPWSISPLGARTAYGATILAIKSVYDWIWSGTQTL